MTNLSLIAIAVICFLAMVFAKPIASALNYVLNFGSAQTGVRVLQRKNYYDVNTGQPFENWSTVYGFKLFLVSQILKF